MLEVAAHFHLVKGCVIKNGQHIVSVRLPTKKKRVREIKFLPALHRDLKLVCFEKSVNILL